MCGGGVLSVSSSSYRRSLLENFLAVNESLCLCLYYNYESMKLSFRSVIFFFGFLSVLFSLSLLRSLLAFTGLEFGALAFFDICLLTEKLDVSSLTCAPATAAAGASVGATIFSIVWIEPPGEINTPGYASSSFAG